MKRIVFISICLLFIINLCSAQSPQLWGMNYNGTVFKVNGDGSGYTEVQYVGDNPRGHLTLGPDGKLYGMNETFIFRIDPVTYAYDTVHWFTVGGGGGGVSSSLTLCTDGNLYGSGSNAIFKFNPIDTAFTSLYRYRSGYWTVQYPPGGLMQGTDGNLYMLCEGGTRIGEGCVCSFNLTTDSLNEMYDLAYPKGDGVNGTLTEIGNGKLIFMSPEIHEGTGDILSVDPSDSIVFDLADFNATVIGCIPEGSLIKLSNGLFYGMTYAGSLPFNDGVIFSFNYYNDTIIDLYNLDGTTGAHPWGSLIQASDSNLYGMTYGGGAYGLGVIFSFNPTTGLYTDIHDFNGANGGEDAYPYGDLIEVSNISTGSASLQTTPTKVTVYPNPGGGEVTITSTKIIDDIKITDMLGQIIVESHPGEMQFNFTIKQQGLFIAAITCNNETVTRKISIIH